MEIKILTILGARPQFIKASILSRLFSESPDFKEIIIHTGQHFDKNMSDVFFKEMEIPHPEYQLNVGGLSHGAMTGRMMEEIESIALNETPNYILVYGDTNSTLAGALVGSKLHLPVIHIEAGLRSYNKQMPEEINRVLTDHCSSLLFCPNQKAIDNLEKEGIAHNNQTSIYNVGDIMYDAALYYKAKAQQKNTLSEIGLKPNTYSLFTCHRPENTENPEKLKEIISAIQQLAEEGNIIVWPVHPRLKEKIANQKLHSNILCISPQGYLDMLNLTQHSNLIFTDSGGLQKEAYFFKKPCITLRKETEWVELVELGANELVGSDSKLIYDAFHKAKPAILNSSIYGDGDCGVKIIHQIKVKYESR